MPKSAKKVSQTARTPITEIIRAMPPAVLHSFRLAAKEVDLELDQADEQGYITGGRMAVVERTAFHKATYLGSLTASHYRMLKQFLPIDESDMGQVMHWPTVEQCRLFWQMNIPSGVRRYATPHPVEQVQ